MELYLKRMLTEKDDLESKIRKAKAALTNQHIHLDKTQNMLLEKQIAHMQDYATILNARINYEKKIAGIDR